MFAFPFQTRFVNVPAAVTTAASPVAVLSHVTPSLFARANGPGRFVPPRDSKVAFVANPPTKSDIPFVNACPLMTTPLLVTALTSAAATCATMLLLVATIFAFSVLLAAIMRALKPVFTDVICAAKLLLAAVRLTANALVAVDNEFDTPATAVTRAATSASIRVLKLLLAVANAFDTPATAVIRAAVSASMRVLKLLLAAVNLPHVSASAAASALLTVLMLLDNAASAAIRAAAY